MSRIAWKCPNCGAALDFEPAALHAPEQEQQIPSGRKARIMRCAHSHCFDVAKQGYVNLLLPRKRGASLPGDSADMVRARTAFLDGGYYRSFSDGVNRFCADVLRTSGITAPVIADAGCGEGYYTCRLGTYLSENGFDAACVGFDLSRHAAAHAARRAAAAFPAEENRLSFAVASLFEMPLQDTSCDGVINLFAPVADAEFARVLKPGGFLLMAVPAEEHLWGLKQAVYEHPYKNDVRRDVLSHFVCESIRRITDTVTVTGSDDIRALFAMTPYYWKTAAADRDKLSALETLTTEIAFDLLLYRKAQ